MAKIVNGINYNDHSDILKMSGLSNEELAEIKLNTQIIGALIEARHEASVSQKKLEQISGVSQPLIARIEKGRTDPQISTILRMLTPLGKTLAVVPINS